MILGKKSLKGCFKGDGNMKRTFTKYPSNISASYDIGEQAQFTRLSRKEAAKRKGNKELLDQYVLLIGTGSNDEQAKEILYDEILSRMNKSQVNASKKISRKEVYEYLDELGGYVGYDDKIDALVEDLGISREDAEGYVWNHASGLDRLNGQR